MCVCVSVQSVFQLVESTVWEMEQQSTLTEKLPFCYPSFPEALYWPLTSSFFPPLCLLFPSFLSLPLPLLVFLSGLKGMLSGPITQETGITETRARRVEKMGEVGGVEEKPGEGDSCKEGGRRGRRGELRCTKISWKVTELKN